jgi:hypothetical protein
MFTCGTEPPQTRQMEGQHRVRLGEKCGMSSMHFSLRPATQADRRKITIRQAVVNFTDWQAARPEEKIFRAATIIEDGYQTRATAQLGRIARELLTATLAPRTTEENATVVPTTTEESEVEKEKRTRREDNGQRSRARSHE